ncbi:MAG: thiol peroxidase [Muribaculaceae bacterium]|nr:thiol peroxidase [Muribaculaceae bacterium]
METVFFQGQEFHTYGSLPAVGTKAPDFTLVTPELKGITPKDFEGKTIVLNVFPSLDTPVCAMSVRKFNKEASGLTDTVVLCVSMDLPFAAGRFCTTEGLKDVIPASAFRSPSFAQNYGLQIVDGPLAGLLARAVIVINPKGEIIYRDLVNEITNEPDYEGAINAIKGKF